MHQWKEVISSASMSPRLWLKICKEIKKNYFSFDGFVVVMGTRTMAYAASALSFMLENLNKPVVITGGIIQLNGMRVVRLCVCVCVCVCTKTDFFFVFFLSFFF